MDIWQVESDGMMQTLSSPALASSTPVQALSAADAALVNAFRTEGYAVVRGLVPKPRIAGMIAHYMDLRAQGPKPGDMGGDPRDATDPLNRYPRFINQHRWDANSEAWCGDAALATAASTAIGQRAVLTQSMLYFKPPGARGQTLHQDHQYITTEPLIGVWVALDRADRANGGMVVVPRSHRQGLFRVRPADITASFTGGGTEMPEGLSEVGVDMEPGDALLFGGYLVHGSYANTTRDRFRRSFICHFVGESVTRFEPAAGMHMSHIAP